VVQLSVTVFFYEVIMLLQVEVHSFLKSLPDSCCFFVSKNSACTFLGVVKGQAIAILVVSDKRRLTKTQINFSSKIYQAGGEHYTINSLENICEIAKIKFWWD